MSTKKLILCLLFLIYFIQFTKADDRKFTYVYQSNVLGKGLKDLEVHTTTRLGKQGGYFAAMDNRLEFEVGLSKKLTTAFYINFRNTTIDNGLGTKSTAFEFEGISSEWKYQISSPIGKGIGFALYSELGLNTDEVELETKLIFDKKIKKTTLALNLTYEPEWELSAGESKMEHKLEGTFGLSYILCPTFHLGFELRQHNVISEGAFEHSAFFGGPVVSYTTGDFFATLTVMPQIAGFKGKTDGSKLNLEEYEKLNARLIFAFHL